MAHAVAHIDKIQMRIDLQHVNVAVPLKGPDARNVDGMISADHHRQCPSLQDRAHARFDVGVAAFGVGVDDIGVANVHDVHVTGQIGDVILVIIGPGMAKAEQGRCLAHPARPKPRARAPLRARIKWRAEDGHIRIQLVPIGHIGPFAKG